AERRRDPLVERLQEKHTAEAPAHLAQGPEQDPAPTEERRHPEKRDDGQHADGGEQQSPTVSLRAERGGSPGEAEEKTVARRQYSEPGEGHTALLPVFLVHPDHHQPTRPPAHQIDDDAPRSGVPP